MVTALIAVLLNGSSLQHTAVATNDLPAIFVSACLDGTVKLTPADATPVAFNELPGDLRDRLGKPASSQVWRVDGPGRAFLYVLENRPNLRTSPRVCGVASDDMDYTTAKDLVEKRVVGDVYSETGMSMQWIDPKHGYIVTVTTAGEFKILQTDLLGDQQRKSLTKHYGSVPR